MSLNRDDDVDVDGSKTLDCCCCCSTDWFGLIIVVVDTMEFVVSHP